MKSKLTKFEIDQRVAFSTRCGEVVGRVVEVDSECAVIATEIDETIRYRVPHNVRRKKNFRILGPRKVS